MAPTPTASPLDDIPLIEELLRTLHPGLWRYLTPTVFDQHRATLQRAFEQADGTADRYLALSRFLSTLRCGHSYANFYNQRPAVAAELFDQPTRLPFRFRWLGGEMVVTGPAHSILDGVDAPALQQLRPGTVVDAINGQSTQALRTALLPLVRVDGHNDHKALSLLEIRGRQKLEFFDAMHAVVAGAASGAGGRVQDGRHRLEIRDLQGRRRRIEVPALTMGQRHAWVEAQRSGLPRLTGADDQLAAHDWSWQLIPLRRVKARAAVLRMGGWALYNSRWDWRAWMEARLDEVASEPDIQGLIVDIRDNEGGLDCGNPIVERFSAQDSLAPARRWVRYRRVPAHLQGVLDTWDDRFRDWGDLPSAPEPGFYSLPETDTRLKPRGPRIAKPLVVLVNGVNSSATFGFAQRVQQGGLGRLIGEPTGGNRRGINGGAFFFVRLPGSGLEFDLPLIGYFPPGQEPDAGLTPDQVVMLGREDAARGVDPAMVAALGAVEGSTG